MLLRVLKTLLRASPWLLGLILTMYLIVIHGPRLAVDGHAPLAGAGARALLCAVLAALVLGVVWFRRRGNKPVEGQPASPHVILDEPSARELALRERLGAWRRRTGGQLPGFLLIGPAGVDKGPLLGLPANAEEDLRCSSVGGFALFDIGASLINQRQTQEARLWRRLLDDLDPSTGLQLRGLILVLSAARLHSAAPQELDQIALTLRARLEELANRFGKGLTVQLIVSDCEQLPGYTESLAWLAADRREFSLEFSPASANRQLLDGLEQRMGALVEGLDSTELERLQREPDVQVRARLFGFMPMWRGFAGTLQGVLNTALAQERGIAQVALQSVRFSAHPAALEAPAPALLRALQTCRRPSRLRVFLRQGGAWVRPRAHGLVVLVSLLAAVLLLTMYREQDRRLEQVDQLVAAVQQASKHPLPATLGAGALLRLDRFAGVARLLNQRWTPWGTDRQLRLQSRELYTRELQQVLLVDVVQRLQGSLQPGAITGDEVLRHNLALYLMLGGETRMDAAAMRDWYMRAAGGPVEAQRLRLDRHMQRLLALLAKSGPQPLDRGLIEQARHRLAAQPLAQRLYEQLLERMQEQRLAEFSIASVLGSEGMLLFARRSGESLVEGVPGLYTLEGYRRFETLLKPVLSSALVHERSVMGRSDMLASAPVEREILALYHQDYIAHWEVFFDDLQIAGLDQHEHLPRRLMQLAQADSPLLMLLREVARHTELAPALAPEGWLEQAQKQAQRLQPASEITGAQPDVAAHPVALHFQPLHRWLGASAPESPARALHAAVKGAALLMQANQKAAALNVAVPPTEVLQRLNEEIEQLPGLLQPVYRDIAQLGQQQVQQQARVSLAKAWSSEVAPLCERALSGRYPFAGASASDVSLDDFNRMFAVDGAVQGFIEQHLGAQLDTVSRPWRLNQNDAGETLDASLLQTLEQVAQVREGFFSPGQAQAHFEFELSPLTMSAGIASFTLSIDDRRLDYRHGPLRAATFEFPGKALGTELRASVTLLDGRTLTRRAEGAWAWLRLLDGIEQIPTADPRVRHLILDFEGEEVRLQLRAERSAMPFNPEVLSRIRCASTAVSAEAIQLSEFS